MRPRYSLARLQARKMLTGVVDPPTPVIQIARSVARLIWTTDPVIKDAVCFYARGEHRIFVNAEAYEERLRYSIGHETGHVVLNHFEILERYARQIGVEIPCNMFYWNDLASLDCNLKCLWAALEREAEIFSAELLMPARWLYRPETLEGFEKLRELLKVSRQALFYRLDETGNGLNGSLRTAFEPHSVGQVP